MGLPPHAIPIGEALHWSALRRLEDPSAKYIPPNLQAAVSAIKSAKHLMSIVGQSGRPLRWFESVSDREELFDIISARMRDQFSRVIAGIRDSSVPTSAQEEAKLQSTK